MAKYSSNPVFQIASKKKMRKKMALSSSPDVESKVKSPLPCPALGWGLGGPGAGWGERSGLF